MSSPIRGPSSQHPAADAVIDDATDAAVNAGYAERREAARNSPSGPGFAPGKLSAPEVTSEQRRATSSTGGHFRQV